METLTIACLQDENDDYACPASQQEKNSQLMACVASGAQAVAAAADKLAEFCAGNGGDDDGGDALTSVTAAVAAMSRNYRQMYNLYSEKVDR